MKQIIQKGWRPLLAILIFVVLWQVSVRIFHIETWLLPAPTDILAEGRASWDEFVPHLYSTVKLTVIGFTIGVTFGLVVAVILHVFTGIRETFYPFLILSQNIPTIVLAPLLVIWFGFGIFPKLIIATLACFFPVAISALGGFQQTNKELVHYMKMMGATKSQLFWKLELPHSIPAIFSGLKIAATYSVMVAVVSEWLGAQQGVGVFMTLATSSFRTPRVFVAIIVVMVLSLAFFGMIALLERMLLRWNKEGTT